MIRRLFRFLHDTRILHTAGGIAIGLAGAGIAALILTFVVQPLAYQATKGMRPDREGRFVLWFWKGSESWHARDQLHEQLNATYQDLLNTLEARDELIPRPINVFIHDSLDNLTTSVVQRKSTLNEQRLTAPMDLLVGQDPTAPLTELITAYAWGECQSLILRNGLRATLSEPDRDFHAAVAAAGARQLDLEQLLAAEGTMSPSLYHRYASPFSQSMVGSLTDIAGLMQVEDAGIVPLSDLPAIHAASLVRFIAATYGITALRRTWGSGSTEQLLRRLAVPLDTLDEAWHAAIERVGANSPQFGYFQAYYSLLQGRTDDAFAQVSGWTSRLSDDEAELAIRSALLVGDIPAARSFLANLKAAQRREQLAALVHRFDDWIVVERGRCRALGSAVDRDELALLAASAWETIQAVTDELRLVSSTLPERFTILVYPDEAPAADASPLLVDAPEGAAILETIAGDSFDDLSWALAELVPQYAYGVRSLSRLVRSGIASAILHTREALIAHGCGLLATDAWIWFERLDFNRSDIDNVLMEAGLLFRYVLDTWGPEAIARIWEMTSGQTRATSLETALKTVCSSGRKEIEEELLETVLKCP